MEKEDEGGDGEADLDVIPFLPHYVLSLIEDQSEHVLMYVHIAKALYCMISCISSAALPIRT
jgi:hypothetical protein